MSALRAAREGEGLVEQDFGQAFVSGVVRMEPVDGRVLVEEGGVAVQDREETGDGVQVDDIDTPDIGNLLDGIDVGVQVQAAPVLPGLFRLVVVVPVIEQGPMDGRQEGDGRAGEGFLQKADGNVDAAFEGALVKQESAVEALENPFGLAYGRFDLFHGFRVPFPDGNPGIVVIGARKMQIMSGCTPGTVS